MFGQETQIGFWLKPGAPIKNVKGTLLMAVLGGTLVSCTTTQEYNLVQQLSLTPVSFKDVPGWKQDHHQLALSSFKKSCLKLLQKPFSITKWNKVLGRAGTWTNSCVSANTLGIINRRKARKFFENHFRPHKVTGYGLFTGYYEPTIGGSLTRTGRYQFPIYEKPAGWPPTQSRKFSVSGRSKSGVLKYYPTRKEIDDGILEDKAKVLAWASSPVDVFFLHIQGSGIIKVRDNKIMRLGFAGHNGHKYTSIGKVLKSKGEIPSEKLSMQSIRAWLLANPRKAMSVMHKNARYIFFRKLKSAGPLGAQGVSLTPGRSLAIDPKFIPYGTPIWLDFQAPIFKKSTFQRLLIAQDTGAAIRGPVRGDIFFGRGILAAKQAGHLKHRGKVFLLIPQD